MLNEKKLATAVFSTVWSPTADEVSGSNCMGIADIDAGTGTEIGGKIFGISVLLFWRIKIFMIIARSSQKKDSRKCRQ